MRYSGGVSHLLGARDVTVTYPTRTVLDDLTLGLAHGDRIGVVGLNGSGKTTLARVLAGAQDPDEGEVTRRRGLRVGYLSQSDDLGQVDVKTAVVGDAPDHVWAGDPRVRDIIDGLLSDVPLSSPVTSLSGGQVRRVALAKLLAKDWDVLILDEPTNHLDLQGIAWLARHLNGRWKKGEGALVTVTHDRWFLDAVTNKTWEVHDGTVESFDGGYAAYVLLRVERDRIAQSAEAKRKNLMRKELAWLRRGAPARTAKPKFRIEAANELIADVPPPRDTVALTQMAMARLGKRVIDLEGVAFSYDQEPLFEDVTWRTAPGERSAVLGLNGTGKTTLLNLMTGKLQPTVGRVKQGKTVNVGFLDQNFEQLADIGHRRVREVIADLKQPITVDGVEVSPSNLLERIGFSKAHLSSRVADLSGGQKRRLQLLLVLAAGPNVLVLDEPTNDVDTDFLAALEDLLDSWPGTLIVVSHDRYLLERVTDNQYALVDGTLRHMPGGIDQYLSSLEDEGGPAGATPGKSGDATGKTPGPKSDGAKRYASQKKLASLERRMEKVFAKIEGLNAKMAAWDPNDFTGLAELAAEAAALEREGEALEEEWLETAEEAKP